MTERVVESWLTKSSERSYQAAFCYMLSHRGYSVVHLTRHCAMEMGKDVLAVAPDGVPCAFQLKGGDIKLSDWRTEVGPQVEDLVMGAISHPSIPRDAPHRSFLVTNGRIEEEVQRAIADRNVTWQRNGTEPLQTITHGEMLTWALDLGSDLWPSELTEIRGLIEMTLWNGRDVFPKGRLATLLEATLPLWSDAAPSGPACTRALTSAALITSLCVAPFTEKQNHVAEAEAWTVYASYTVALAERWALKRAAYESELSLAQETAWNALGRLVEELYDHETRDLRLIEGHGAIDAPFYRARMTWMVGLVAAYALWRRTRSENEGAGEDTFAFDVDAFAVRFAHRHRPDPALWGEAAVPQLLAYHWLWRVTDGTWDPDWWIARYVRYIAAANAPRSTGSIPGPYYEIGDLARHWIDAELDGVVPADLHLSRRPMGETFAGTSVYLEALFHLIVRKNYKQATRLLWPSVSSVSTPTFATDEPWHQLRWRCLDVGHERLVQHEPTQQWADVRVLAESVESEQMPEALRNAPAFALLHMIVFPHRGTSARVRWLDTTLRRDAYVR